MSDDPFFLILLCSKLWRHEGTDLHRLIEDLRKVMDGRMEKGGPEREQIVTTTTIRLLTFHTGVPPALLDISVSSGVFSSCVSIKDLK